MKSEINPNDTAYAGPLIALVSSIEAGIKPDTADMGWFEAWIHDEFSGDWDYSAFAIDELCDGAFNDTYALEELGIEEGALSDRQRIDFGRAYLNTLMEEGGYQSQIYIKQIQVMSQAGASVTLVAALSDAPLMSEVEFLGGCVKNSDTDIVADCGYIDEYELASVSDEWILAHWSNV